MNLEFVLRIQTTPFVQCCDARPPDDQHQGSRATFTANTSHQYQDWLSQVHTNFITKTNLRCNYYYPHYENEEIGASKEGLTCLSPSLQRKGCLRTQQEGAINKPEKRSHQKMYLPVPWPGSSSLQNDSCGTNDPWRTYMKCLATSKCLRYIRNFVHNQDSIKLNQEQRIDYVLQASYLQ